ncbi:MAG TPA: hypothetical protein VEL47_04990 [Myxococcota bacterium]|nr:hypothetical protein [Myxococcota bacterium]
MSFRFLILGFLFYALCGQSAERNDELALFNRFLDAHPLAESDGEQSGVVLEQIKK